jgi:5-methylcytosine-specific restriction endonuclease McrA
MSLVALKEVLDDSNIEELLERASGLSEPEVRQLVLRLGQAPMLAQLAPATPAAAIVAADPVATATADPAASSTVVVEPRVELEAVTLWVGGDFREELEAVRALLGHAVPSGKKEDVLLHVLRAQRRVLERRRYGSPKPTSKSAEAPTRADYIPASLGREVYQREGGSCAYIGEEQRRCGSTLRLEYQHIVPLACGGPSTPDNVTLFCRAHNLLQARKDFGEEHIQRKQLERSAADALVRLGYQRREAEQIVGVAIRELPGESDLQSLLRESLKILARSIR